jgi:hypothetical protein
MLQKKSLVPTPASAPAGILTPDRQIVRQKQARRPPAAAASTWHHQLILLAKNREPVRVALKSALHVKGRVVKG